MQEIYTIGYAGFKIQDFLKVLKKYQINSLIDVRSNPYSKIYADYNKEALNQLLQHNKIIYRNYSSEFGARQSNMEYYPNGYLDFLLFSKSQVFQEGITKIIRSIPLGFNFVLMCSEKDPITCHRNIMVAREFYKKGIEIKNILSDGSYITQAEIEKKLVEYYYPNRNQLSFLEADLSWEEMVDNSYKFQNEKIGYHLEDEVGSVVYG